MALAGEARLTKWSKSQRVRRQESGISGLLEASLGDDEVGLLVVTALLFE